MISVIVPVYNVEPYLRKCLDSILGQTYRDLEVLVIDDGSTDGSGKICDEYKKDERVRVFHTENRGLSATRNLGLDKATGEWIGFVDSDDWIEPDMYEVLFRKAEETGADVVECGSLFEYPTKTTKHPAVQSLISETESVLSLLKGKVSTLVWNKLYRRKLFDNTRFPDGRSFEDIATTHKIIQNAKVVGVPNYLYHWLQRESGISQSHDLKNLIDYWLAYKERNDDLNSIVDEEANAILLKGCAYAIARTWVWYLRGEKDPKYITEISSFARENYPVFGFQGWPLYLRICIFLSRFRNTASFAMAYYLNQLYRRSKPKYFE